MSYKTRTFFKETVVLKICKWKEGKTKKGLGSPTLARFPAEI
jgi:hypothetical protein